MDNKISWRSSNSQTSVEAGKNFLGCSYFDSGHIHGTFRQMDGKFLILLNLQELNELQNVLCRPHSRYYFSHLMNLCKIQDVDQLIDKGDLIS